MEISDKLRHICVIAFNFSKIKKGAGISNHPPARLYKKQGITYGSSRVLRRILSSIAVYTSIGLGDNE